MIENVIVSMWLFLILTFLPKSISTLFGSLPSSLSSVIVRMSVVLKKTVGE